MKFFKSHSIKYKNYKVILVPEKFDDIRNDAFKGITPEYIIFSEKTQIIRNYAFSGVSACNIFLPDSIIEIEEGAFDDMGEDVVIYCNQGSYADKICGEFGIGVSYEKIDVASLIEEQERMLKKPEPVNVIEELPIEEIDNEHSDGVMEEAPPSSLEKLEGVSDIVSTPEIDEKDGFESNNEEKEMIAPPEIDETNVIVETEPSEIDDNNVETKGEIIEEALTLDSPSIEMPIVETPHVEPSSVETSHTEAQPVETSPIKPSLPVETPPTSNVRCLMFDEMHGISESIVRYEGLSDTIKSHIIDGELYVYCKYVNGNRTTSFISKSDFQMLLSRETKTPETQPIQETKCEYCNEKINPGDAFCAKCGRKVKNVIKCPRCNEPNDANDNFCAYCGKKL